MKSELTLRSVWRSKIMSARPIPSGRSCTYIETVAETGDDTADDHLREAVRHELEDGADRKNEHAEHDAVPSPESVAIEEAEDGSQRTADLI